jgi:hypothetical protein
MAAAKAKGAPREANVLACDAWAKRMLGFRGPAQLSHMLAMRSLSVAVPGCAICCLRSAFNLGLATIRRPKDDATPLTVRRFNCEHVQAISYLCRLLDSRPFRSQSLSSLNSYFGKLL